jgi:hypothetical protein
MAEFKKRLLPAGRLVIDRGAHDEVESSRKIFRSAAELLAVVLVESRSESDLMSVVRETIRSWP